MKVLAQFRSFLISTSVMLSAGCSMRGCTGETKDIPPEDQLHSYISMAVNVTLPEQREELVSLTTGALKSALVNASEESFKKAYIDKKYDFKTFEIVSRKDNPDSKEIELDFKLVYRSWHAGEPPDRAPLLETVNRANMVYDHGQWALSRVESLSSSFEWEVGLPMDGVSTTGVKPEDPPVEIESSREQNIEEQKQREEPTEELKK